MIGVGILWAIAAPLSLVGAVVCLSLVARRFVRNWWIALFASSALVFLPVTWIWQSDHRAFEDICHQATHAFIRKRVPAEGFLLDSKTANSFGMRYLQEEGFSFTEAQDIARREGWVRYVRDTKGRVVTVKIDRPGARFLVRESFAQPSPSVGLSLTTINNRDSGQELARAGSATFDGGRANWFLGAWGVDSCPNPYSSPDAFENYYHLVRKTLR